MDRSGLHCAEEESIEQRERAPDDREARRVLLDRDPASERREGKRELFSQSAILEAVALEKAISNIVVTREQGESQCSENISMYLD